MQESTARVVEAARALAAEGSQVTTRQAFERAGYELRRRPGAGPMSCGREVFRNGRRIAYTRNAYEATAWLVQLGKRIERKMK